MNIMQTRLLLTILVLICSGCALTDFTTQEDKSLSTGAYAQSGLNNNSLHRHVEKLARQLFSTAQPIDPSRSLAVGTILPASGQNGDSLPLTSSLGVQLQESLMTFASQAGLKVVEYKAMPAIKIGKHADTMLSRDVDKLNKNISPDYFLTGTYTEQENSLIVNIRLIQVPENIVLAAATDYIPDNTMWSRSKVSLKENKIYRSAN